MYQAWEAKDPLVDEELVDGIVVFSSLQPVYGLQNQLKYLLQRCRNAKATFKLSLKSNTVKVGQPIITYDYVWRSRGNNYAKQILYMMILPIKRDRFDKEWGISHEQIWDEIYKFVLTHNIKTLGIEDISDEVPDDKLLDYYVTANKVLCKLKENEVNVYMAL